MTIPTWALSFAAAISCRRSSRRYATIIRLFPEVRMPAALPLRPDEPEWLGGYRLTGRLGEGGQGAVYLGQAPDGRQVAVKVLHAHFAHDDTARSRFMREVATARQVE